MFYEDPFDRWCRYMFELGCLITLFLELEVYAVYRRGFYTFQILALRIGLLFRLAGYKIRSCSYAVYRCSICMPLMLCGLMKVPTWSEVEQYRLQLVARSGVDIPRPLILEEGLQQEQGGKPLYRIERE